MQPSILFFLFVLLSSKLTSQDLTEKVLFNISYFGILGTHPGIKLGVQYPLTTFKDNGNRTTNLDQLAGATSLILYFHRRNQLGIGLNAEVGYRNRKAGKTNKEAWIGLGYLRTCTPNRVYDWTKEEHLIRQPSVGTNHLLKTAAIGLGRNRGKGLDGDFWMVRPTLMHIKPYNTGTTFNFAIDAGYYFY